MLRITENLESELAVRLRLDGTLSIESFDELARICTRYQSNKSQTVIVDMAGVSFMHDEAARGLARLRAESVRVINCSPFIAALLNSAIA
jgi:anti-anti-sigma regulatory factor